MKKFFIAILLLLGVIFFISRFTEVQNIGAILRQGDWYFMVLALILELLFLLNQGFTYSAIYQSLGIEENRLHMFMVASAAYFINIVTPTAGASAIAVFLTDAKNRRKSTARVTVAWALFLLFDYSAMVIVLILGLGVLARRNNIHWPEITASILLMLVALGLAVLIYLGAQAPVLLGKVLAWMAINVNRVMHIFTRKEFISVERAYSFADDAAEGISVIRSKPRSLIAPLLLALLSKTLLILVLACMFLAFEVPFSAGTVIAGFAIGYLFAIVSPTPSGIGIVEGILTLSLTSLRVPLDAATIITLAFRGFTFWIPLLIGIFNFRRLSSLQKQTAN